MAYQLSTVVAKVQRRIRDTGYSATEITDYINDTQNEIFNEYKLPFMQAVQTYTLTPNVSDITNGAGLPTNYVQALDVTITTANQERTIPFKDIREVDLLHPDPDDLTANPASGASFWYFYANTIRVYPAPKNADTLSVRYYKRPTTLANDADVPSVPSEFEELLVVGAAYRVLQVKDNYDQAGVLQAKYDEILQKLVMKYNRPQVGTPTRMRMNRHAMGKTSY